MRAIIIGEPGPPSVMQVQDVELPSCGAGQVLVRNEAIGLNFLDVYYRTGRYPASYPLVIGHEGAGVVEKIGDDVSDLVVGDRVGYVDQIGAYSEFVVRPASRLIKIPASVTLADAASVLLKGMTAEYLIQRTFKVEPWHTIVVHAAAGGVGQILCQWAKQVGATVIGTVGTAKKRTVAEAAGCDYVIVNEAQDFVAEVHKITDGEGVPVVYDGVGSDSFTRSLDCLAPRGLLAAFGAAAGLIPPLDVQGLAAKGALYVTRPTMGPYMKETADLRSSAADLFARVVAGDIVAKASNTYKLDDVVQAHIDLEARKLVGSTILIP